MSQPSIVLTFIGGFEIGDGMEGSGDWGLYASSARIRAMVASTLKGLGGRLRSLRLGGTSSRIEDSFLLVRNGGRTKEPILNETKSPILETRQNRQFRK